MAFIFKALADSMTSVWPVSLLVINILPPSSGSKEMLLAASGRILLGSIDLACRYALSIAACAVF